MGHDYEFHELDFDQNRKGLNLVLSKLPQFNIKPKNLYPQRSEGRRFLSLY